MTEIDIPASAEFLRYPFGEEDALAFVRRWCALLAAEDYEAAYGMTAHYRVHRRTPSLLKCTIESYDGYPEHVEKRCKITPLESVTSTSYRSGPRHEVEFHSFDGEATKIDGMDLCASIWFDLPLNGAWSDLTATFDVLARGNQAIVVLDQVHVF